MMFKHEARDPNTFWLLLEIHAGEKRKYKGAELGFWTKVKLWLKDKL